MEERTIRSLSRDELLSIMKLDSKSTTGSELCRSLAYVIKLKACHVIDRIYYSRQFMYIYLYRIRGISIIMNAVARPSLRSHTDHDQARPSTTLNPTSAHRSQSAQAV